MISPPDCAAGAISEIFANINHHILDQLLNFLKTFFCTRNEKENFYPGMAKISRSCQPAS
jgi:hypothetical protein